MWKNRRRVSGEKENRTLVSPLSDASYRERPPRNINRGADSVDKGEQIRMVQRQFDCSAAGHRKSNERPVRASRGSGKPRFPVGDKVVHDVDRVLFLCCAVLLLWPAGLRAEERLAPGARADRVLVEKREHTLTLLDHGKVLKKYRVALGGDPVGPKALQGDHKTPEVVYDLDRRNAHSEFYRSIQISYPNAQDRAWAREAGVAPGGDVMVHGLPNGYGWLGGGHRARDGRMAASRSRMRRWMKSGRRCRVVHRSRAGLGAFGSARLRGGVPPARGAPLRTDG